MATEKTQVDLTEELVAEFGENASYVADLLARWRANPSAVDEEWRQFFRERLGESPVKGEGRRANGELTEPAERVSPSPKVESEVVAPRALREGEERQPIRGGALRIAENMEASLQVPTATSQRQIPVKLLEENRRVINEWRASNEESKVSVTHLIAWAILQA